MRICKPGSAFWRCRSLYLVLLPLCGGSILAAQNLPPDYFSGLKWRLIGPFRAGRVVAVAGVPGSGTEFYFGSVDGGIWKTTDAGTVWEPIFDGQPVGSIGALAVSPSNPKVIYAGTGESDIRSDLASGDGVYKSTNGGETWENIGLDDSRQISRILIDPRDSNVVYAGVLGHVYGPSSERGVYKSTDGGATWKRVLDKGSSVGIADMAMAIGKPSILFAATWNAHRPPWSVYGPLEGAGSGLYRSTDGGETWSQITGSGLPQGDWGRAGVAVSADGRRVYAAIDDKKKSGLYRSDDGGDTWRMVNTDPRLTSRAWYFNCITIDPQNPDVLYIPNVALYRTEDGGKTISIVRGAPGGDDYHQIWIDPQNSSRMILGVDQGTTISLDDGKTWTTWYNQPTAQLYHLTTDHRTPYAVYGAQQDSGAIAVFSRTDHGQIAGRDWFQPGASESGYIAIDPRDDNVLYVSGTYGTVERFDRKTSFSQIVTPWPLNGFGTDISKRRYRDPWTPVLVFSPADKTSLYLGTQYVLKTVDGGLNWRQISPDLTGTVKGTSTEGPATTGNTIERGYGVVYTIAPSPLNAREIWAGSDTGLIHLSTDGGKSWKDVTPKGLSSWSKISLIEASHFEPATAYAAVDRHRLDDYKPYLYITRDYGKTWHLAVAGIAPASFLRCIREDPKQRGLLYAGTEFGIYVSFDEGDNWQPLQLNLPATSVRDIDVHGNDLVIATHGRSFWILDDITPLRQSAAARKASNALLYAPEAAERIDNDAFLGTPLPPEEPTAENPPHGAIIDYVLKSPAQKVTLEIYDANNVLVRHYSSGEKPPKPHPSLPIAARWFPAPPMLSAEGGEHRFIWDLALGESGDDEDDEEDLRAPRGPRMVPGTYTVRLTADGQTFQQPLRIAMDPRVHASQATLLQQYDLARKIYADSRRSRKAMAEMQSVEKALQGIQHETVTHPGLVPAFQRVESGMEKILGSEDGDDPGMEQANAGLGTVLRVVESGHRAVPAQAIAIYQITRRSAAQYEAQWRKLKTTELVTLNQQLEKANLKTVQIAQIEQDVDYVMTR